MTTIAELGFAVHSESAVQAADNLDGMVEAGARAEQAINKVAETSEQAKSRLLALGKAALESSTYQETLNRAYEATAGASAAAAREQLNQSAALRQSAKAASESSAAQEKVVASEKKATAAIAEQRTQLEQLLAKIDPTTAALARLGDQQRQLEKFKTNSYRICLRDNGRLTDGNINRFNRMKGRKKCVDDQFCRMFNQFWLSILNDLCCNFTNFSII